MPSFEQYMSTLFAPLVEAAELPDLSTKLITSPLAEERREEQFAKLARLKRHRADPVYLGSAGFVTRYVDGGSVYICLTTETLTDPETEHIETWAGEEGLVATDVDESTFLFLTYEYRQLFRVKSINLQRIRARNLIDVVQPSGKYEHAIEDVMLWYEKVLLFEIPADSRYREMNEFAVAARVAAAHGAYRTPLLPDSVVNVLVPLVQADNVNPENLFFALTSSHWKHVFLELYKCVEFLFFLPWTTKLKGVLAYPGSAYELAKDVQGQLPYRPTEKELIRDLFEMLPDETVFDATLAPLPSFAELLGNKNATKGAFGERIYRLRNQLVHQGDYEFTEPLTVSMECWPPLVTFLANVALRLYTHHRGDVNCNFLLPNT